MPTHRPALRALAFCLAVACSASDPADDSTQPALDPSIDFDGDGILDVHEGAGDPDGDGIPNYRDLDSDGDCIPDAIERGSLPPGSYPVDSDLDGLPDFLDSDADDNGIPDRFEVGDCNAPFDADGDGIADFADLDDDDDGILDIHEWEIDVDGDGLPGRLDTDSDGDCIPDRYEAGDLDPATPPVDSDRDGYPDFVDLDSDGDGIPDRDEVTSCDPPSDLDGDGLPDHIDDDTDGDGLPDWLELAIGTDHRSPDTDGDGQTDLVEWLTGSDPQDPDVLFPGPVVIVPDRGTAVGALELELELRRVDLVLLPGSMEAQPRVHALDQFLDLAERLIQIDGLDVAVAVGGQPGDPRFVVLQQITTDLGRAYTLVPDLLARPSIGRKSWDGIYQTLTGEGFDKNCNLIYDPEQDVLPFIAHPKDAFLGLWGQSHDPSDPSTGRGGGVGFRMGATRFVLYQSDVAICSPTGLASGGCPDPAQMPYVVSLAKATGTTLIGLNGDADWRHPTTGEILPPKSQMLEVAQRTGARYTRDGQLHELVFDVYDFIPWGEELFEILRSRVGTSRLHTLELTVRDDPHGFVTDPGPRLDEVDVFYGHRDVVPLPFDVTAALPAARDDTAFVVTFEILADDELYEVRDAVIVVRPNR